jgi:NAD(P)-dependent dehydrogenase (short-subunit alcohol dehydrogenase family)
MALELGPLDVRVNAVVPGMIRTPMTAVMFQDPENVNRIRAAHPIGREGQPEEVAAAIAFPLVARVNPKRSRQRLPSCCLTMPVSSPVWLFRSMAVQLRAFGHTKTTGFAAAM